MTDQFRIVGGEKTPTLCKNEGEGSVVNKSFRTIAKVTSVIPYLKCPVSIVYLRGDINSGRMSFEIKPLDT